MPFNTPSFDELVARAQADFEARLPGADARLRVSLLNILAQIHSSAAVGLHQHLRWLARQILPDTADAEYLSRQASNFGLTRAAATFARGNATFTGSNGSVIPAGTVVQLSGNEYTTDAEVTIASDTATVGITATTAGAVLNADVGVQLSTVNPVAGVDSTVLVAAGGLTGGAETESDDRLRARLLLRLREPPHGGAAHDYVAWALAAHPDVTRAWAYPLENGPGTVVVRCVTDDLTTPIPSAAIIQAVADYIDPLRPVTANVSIVAPVSVALQPVFTSLTPDTPDVRAAILAEIQDLIRRESEPGGTLLLSKLREAVSLAVGESDHVMTQPSANVTHAIGQIPTIVAGNITWPT